MNELINFLNQVYARCEEATSARSRWTAFCQAFGAVSFFKQLRPELDDEIIALWETKYYDRFMELWISSAN